MSKVPRAPERGGGSEPVKPPFELYRDCDIADADGHICTAENPEIAAELLALLQSHYALDEWLEKHPEAKHGDQGNTGGNRD